MSQTYHTDHDLIVILGPTATGKTRLAVYLANKLNGEIISADSRQVYRGMNIGTGKDINEYELNGETIPYHLIDIANPHEEYNVFQFQYDFQNTFLEINERKKLPILCGGTGFYIKSILMDFQLPAIAPDKKLRKELENWELEDLIFELKSISPDVPKKSLETKRRVIRAIEVKINRDINLDKTIYRNLQYKIHNPIVLGVDYPRGVIRDRITNRLHERLDQGMIQEVEKLLASGISHEQLEKFGLEYRFISRYLLGQFEREEMVEKLNTAIHQFAKRQMTFFRNIEKNGISIHWIVKGNMEKALDIICKKDNP